MDFINQLIVLISHPVAQDLSYHQFCDQRSLFFIPNFMDVASSGFFLWVSLKGINYLKRMDILKREPVHKCWKVFFYSLFYVGLGAAYYHWKPNNLGLFLDRLPMAVAFMALLSAIITERVNWRLGIKLFPFLILLGAMSIIYWIYTEYQGVGDLRPYIIVQYGGILALILIIIFGEEGEGNQYLIIALGLYAMAKLVEYLDCQVFAATSYWLSGHTFKHILAAFASYILYKHMKMYTNRC